MPHIPLRKKHSLGQPALLQHLFNKLFPNVVLNCTNLAGIHSADKRFGNEVSKNIRWIELLNLTLQIATHFSERQTSSRQPPNPRKELKSKEVRAAEIKQSSQLQGYKQKPYKCNFIFSLVGILMLPMVVMVGHRPKMHWRAYFQELTSEQTSKLLPDPVRWWG